MFGKTDRFHLAAASTVLTFPGIRRKSQADSREREQKIYPSCVVAAPNAFGVVFYLYVTATSATADVVN